MDHTSQEYSTFTTNYLPPNQYESIMLSASKLKSPSVKFYERRETYELALVRSRVFSLCCSAIRSLHCRTDQTTPSRDLINTLAMNVASKTQTCWQHREFMSVLSQLQHENDSKGNTGPTDIWAYFGSVMSMHWWAHTLELRHARRCLTTSVAYHITWHGHWIEDLPESFKKRSRFWRALGSLHPFPG